jgi:HEAT repeat protein
MRRLLPLALLAAATVTYAGPEKRAPLVLRPLPLAEGVRDVLNPGDDPKKLGERDVYKRAKSVGIDLARSQSDPVVGMTWTGDRLFYVFYKTVEEAFADRPYVIQRIKKTQRTWAAPDAEPAETVTFQVEAFKLLGGAQKRGDQHYGSYGIKEWHRREVVKEYEIGFGEVPGQCEGTDWPFDHGILFEYVKEYGPERDTYDAVRFQSSVTWSLSVSLDRDGSWYVRAPELGIDLPAAPTSEARTVPPADPASEGLVLVRGVGGGDRGRAGGEGQPQRLLRRASRRKREGRRDAEHAPDAPRLRGTHRGGGPRRRRPRPDPATLRTSAASVRRRGLVELRGRRVLVRRPWQGRAHVRPQALRGSEMMTARIALIGALALLTTLPATAQDRPAHPRWAGSIEDGLAEAKERGVALMVALNMDRERGNQEMVDEVYTSEEFHEAAKSCVIAMASMWEHSTSGTCPRFGHVTCEQHRVIEDTVRRDWLGKTPKDDVESPRHFFLAPNGKILFQRVWTMKAKDLAELMQRASELCTPGRLEAWDTLEGRMERAFDPIASVRDIALAELIAENDPEIDAALAARAKKEKDANVVGSVLAAYATADTPERRALVHDALKHKAPEVRMRVALAMRQSGSDEHLKPLLARVGKEKDEKAKATMCRAIGALGPEDAKVRKALVKALGDKQELVREQAAVAIAPFATEKAVKAGLRKILLAGGSQDTRMAAAWALGHSEDKAVQDELVEYEKSLGRWDWKLRRAVEEAIKKLKGRPVDDYDGLPTRFLPDPAEGEKPKDWGRGGR